MFLTRKEIRDLTGFTRPSAQVRWLQQNDWRFGLNGLGKPVIAVAEFNLRMVGGSEQASTPQGGGTSSNGDREVNHDPLPNSLSSTVAEIGRQAMESKRTAERCEAKTLSVREAAAQLQMSPVTLRKWAAAGRVRAYKPGKVWIFLADELNEYLKAHIRCPSIAARTVRTSGAVFRLMAKKSGSQLAHQIAAKRKSLRLSREIERGDRPN